MKSVTVKLSVLLSLLLVPGAAAQDSLTVAAPEDRDCSDFETRVAAQGWYDAMQVLYDEQDPHRLDANGDGEACESIEVIRRIQADSLIYYTTVERPQTLVCVDTSFTWGAYVSEARGGLHGEGEHTEWTTMNQCVDIQLGLRQPLP